jgi:hypothetical protein
MLRHFNTLGYKNLSIQFKLSSGRYTYECAAVSACDGNKNVIVVAKLKHVQNPVMTRAENEMRKIWAMQNSLGIREGSIFHIMPVNSPPEVRRVSAPSGKRLTK